MVSTKKLVIITSNLAPYRVPVFEELNQNIPIEVLLNGAVMDIHPWNEIPKVNFTVTKLTKWWRLCFARNSCLVVTPWNDIRVIIIVLIRKLLGIPSIGFYESTLKSHRFNRGPVAWIRRFVFHKFGAVVTVGKASTAAVLSMGLTQELILESFNAVDVEEFNLQTNSRRKQLVQSNGHDVVFIGQLISRKNLHSALLAWELVREDQDNFHIIGDGPLKDDLLDLVRKLNLTDSVKFHGYLQGSSLFTILATSRTLVLPSTQEVWGLVANEALASGLHVVVSECCGVAESVKDMRGVYVCSPTIESLSIAFLESKRDWQEYINEPEILKHTPDSLANTILDAASRFL